MWLRIVFALVIAGWTTSVCHASERPNVVVFIADDVSWNDYGCYGNAAARTPAIDRLAEHGLRFDNAFLTASSCSPSRASIITGRYPHNNGKAAELHLPIAGNLPWFPERLRQTGYYCALSGKNHMTADASIGAENPQDRVAPFDLIDGGKEPGNSGGHANWVKILRERPTNKPFFFWFAAYDAHRGWDADDQWDASQYGAAHDPASVVVPPFLVDDAATRRDLASYYNEVTRFDHYVGQVVNELERQNQLENTLILVLADNGRPFPRAKTRLHDSGMKTALVAHWPAGISIDTNSTTSLVSVIDLAPTILSVAGAEIPETVQGISLQPLFENARASVRRYAFSEHNWHDYEAHGRSVRDGKYLYITNQRPHSAWEGPADSVRSPSHVSLKSRRDAGQLGVAQGDVFLNPRPSEELYLVSDDPNQLNNLINDSAHASEATRLRAQLKEWSIATGDSVPANLSKDSFDRETGVSLKIKNAAFRGMTPGEDNQAWLINEAGPN